MGLVCPRNIHNHHTTQKNKPWAHYLNPRVCVLKCDTAKRCALRRARPPRLVPITAKNIALRLWPTQHKFYCIAETSSTWCLNLPLFAMPHLWEMSSQATGVRWWLLSVDWDQQLFLRGAGWGGARCCVACIRWCTAVLARQGSGSEIYVSLLFDYCRK